MEYGPLFADLVTRWTVIENEHDRLHPKRDQCGGVGGCSMMFVAVGLQQQMIDALTIWRRESARAQQSGRQPSDGQ
jgi:hypothetical protein